MSETSSDGPGGWPKARVIASNSRGGACACGSGLPSGSGCFALQGRGGGPDAGDVCPRLWSWQSYTPGTNLRAWLLRILTNLNIDRGRRAQRAPDSQPLEEGDYFLYNRIEAATGETEEERVLQRLSQDNVAEALSEVPHDFRDVVVLVDIGEFSYAEAAQILDIPIGTVMSRLHRGRRILKKELADLAVDSR